jgi:hypothetical protein
MFNKILLICLLLAHLQITAFAVETEKESKKAWFNLPSIRIKSSPETEILDQTPVAQKKIKGHLFSLTIRSMFKQKETDNKIKSNTRLKMPFVHMTTDVNPDDWRMNEDYWMMDLDYWDATPQRKNYIPVYELMFQQHKEKSAEKYSDNTFIKTTRSLDMTNQCLTLFANDLIKGNSSFFTVGQYGKFCLSNRKENFTELPLNTRWYIIKKNGKVRGLSAEFYEKDEHTEKFNAYKSIFLTPDLRKKKL